MRKETKYLLVAMLIGAVNVFSQTPGALLTTPITSALNPNGDSYVTASGGAYLINDQDESELSWVSILQYDSEPSGDLNVGGSCGTTDIMDDPSTGGDASYVLFDDPDGIADNGDEIMMYRLRISRDPGNGNFGFSVLMDLDGLFGSTDPDSVQGNPGFEAEIRVVNGGGSKGVHVDDVRGTTSGSNLAVYNINAYTQRSYALVQNTACTGKPAVFYDFRIPFSILSSNFGITTSDAVRLVGATSINGASVLGSTASDIAGIDDDNYANSIAGQDEAFSDFVNNQQPASIKEISGFGTLPVELTSFTGKVLIGSVKLEWVTAMELDNDYFIVEKSLNGVNFFPIGEVDGQGASSEVVTYSYVDYSGMDDVAYYRLKQVDLDGTFEYSHRIVVKSNTDKQPEFFPNPAKDFVNIKANSFNGGILTIRNIQGVLVVAETIRGDVSVNLSDFAKGWYSFSITNENGVYSERVLVK